MYSNLFSKSRTLRELCMIIVMVMVTLISAAQAQDCGYNFITDGLIVYYPFEDNSQDMSGNSNNGINAASGVSYAPGKCGQAVSLDGSNGYIQLTNSLNATNGLTFSFWMNSSGLISGQKNGIIISKYDWNYYPPRNFSVGSTGQKIGGGFNYDINTGDGANIYYSVEQDKPLETDKWYHVVINTTPDAIELYVDGKLVNAPTRRSSTYKNTANMKTFIGNAFNAGGGANNHYHGMLDEFRVYNRPLTETEINQLYHFSPDISMIKATAGGGGTISPSGSITVTNGENSTITVTPNPCYEVDKVFVDGSEETLTNGKYTFENVTAEHTFSVTFKQKQGCKFGSDLITDGLLAYYIFDGDYQDKSGNNNHSTPFGDVPFVDGKFGKAASLNGALNYLRITNPAQKFDKQFTISGWVSTNGRGMSVLSKYSWQHALQKGRGFNLVTSSPDISNLVLFGNTVFISVMFDQAPTSNPAQNLPTYTLPVREFKYVSAVYDTGNMKLFVDGNLVSEKTIQHGDTLDNPYDMLIGTYWTNNATVTAYDTINRAFDGLIDELRVYNRALSSTEIRQLYEGGSEPSNENECEINLINNTTTCNGLCPLTVIELGNGKSIVKFDLDPAKCGNYTGVEFIITYNDDPVCYSAHFAKSEFADGTEQGDAEAIITDNDLNVRTEDCRQVVKSPAIAHGKDFTLKISNKNVAWNNGLAEIGSLYSDYLIPLNQSSNYDFYAAFNRTVGDATKTGSGVAKVKIRFLKELPMLSLGDVKTCIGNMISVPLILSNPGGEAIQGIDVRIPYPASLIPETEAVTLIKGILENKGYDLDYNVINGEIRIGIYAEEETFFAGSGTIAYLNFETSEAGNTELSFTKGLVNEKSVDTKAGKVEIGNCCTVSGKVLYYSDNQRPVLDVTVTIEGNGISETTVTDEEGYYELTVPCGYDYTVTLSKNNHLGGLSFLDVSKIARFVAEFADAVFTPLQMLAADVTLDGIIDAVDASRLARYIVGKIECMNDGCINWIFVPENQQYKPLNESMTDQDFIGIRLGDVTGNWTKDASRSLKNTRSVSSEYRLTTNSGSQITVPVILNQDDSIEGIDIFISFDKNILKPRSATLKGGILADKGYNLLYGVKNAGEMKIGISANSNIVKDKGNVVFITFDVIGKGTSPVSLTSFDCNEAKAAGGFSAGSKIYDKLQVFVK